MSLPDLNPCKCPAVTEDKQQDFSTNFLNDSTYNTDHLADTVEILSQHVKRDLPNTIQLTPVPKPPQERPTFIESVKEFTNNLNWTYVIGGGLVLLWLTQDRRKNLG